MEDIRKQFQKTEDDLKALQSVGQMIGEVLRQLDDQRCAFFFVCVTCFLLLLLCVVIVCVGGCESLGLKRRVLFGDFSLILLR